MEDENEGTVEKRTEMPILEGMDRLEDSIRNLHDRLTPVMIQPTDAESGEGKQLPCSPLFERIVIMNEFIMDINRRLEI